LTASNVLFLSAMPILCIDIFVSCMINNFCYAWFLLSPLSHLLTCLIRYMWNELYISVEFSPPDCNCPWDMCNYPIQRALIGHSFEGVTVFISVDYSLWWKECTIVILVLVQNMSLISHKLLFSSVNPSSMIPRNNSSVSDDCDERILS